MNDKKLLHMGIIPPDEIEKRMDLFRQNPNKCRRGVRRWDINVIPEHYELIVDAVKRRCQEVLVMENHTPYGEAPIEVANKLNQELDWYRRNYKIWVDPGGAGEGTVVKHAKLAMVEGGPPVIGKVEKDENAKIAVYTASHDEAVYGMEYIYGDFDKDRHLDLLNFRIAMYMAVQNAFLKVRLETLKLNTEAKEEIARVFKGWEDQSFFQDGVWLCDAGLGRRYAENKGTKRQEVLVPGDTGNVCLDLILPDYEEEIFRPGMIEQNIDKFELSKMITKMIGDRIENYPAKVAIMDVAVTRKGRKRAEVSITYIVMACLYRDL